METSGSRAGPIRYRSFAASYGNGADGSGTEPALFHGRVMAGDWIKVEKSTLRKPEILALAAKLHLHPDHALGMVLRFWDWVDSNSQDGVIAGVTGELLDTFLGTPGLAAGLVSVGWLSERSHGLTIPNFDRHMGSSSKTRAVNALRTARHRSNAQCNGPNVTTSSLLCSPEEQNPKEGENTQTGGGGAGEGVRPECWLTRQWLEYFRGTQHSERDWQKLDGFFAELLRQGWPADRLEAAIRDEKRDRRQASWEFAKWLGKPPPKPLDLDARRREIAAQRAARAADDAEVERDRVTRRAKA